MEFPALTPIHRGEVMKNMEPTSHETSKAGEEKMEIREKSSTTKPDPGLEELEEMSAKEMLALWKLKTPASVREEARDLFKMTMMRDLLAQVKGNLEAAASELMKGNGRGVENYPDEKGERDTEGGTVHRRDNVTKLLNPDDETRQERELNRLPSPFLDADGTVSSLPKFVPLLTLSADLKENRSISTEGDVSSAIDTQGAQTQAQSRVKTSKSEATGRVNHPLPQAQNPNDDSGPIVTFLRSALDATTRELERKSKWCYLQEQNIAQREEEVKRKEKEVSEWISRLSELTGVIKERERNVARKEEMARIMLAGYAKFLPTNTNMVPELLRDTKGDGVLKQIVVHVPPTADMIDSSEQQHNGGNAPTNHKHDDGTDDESSRVIASQDTISADNTPPVTEEEQIKQDEPEYSAEEFEQFLSKFEADPAKRQMPGEQVLKTTIDTDQLIDLTDSLEVHSDLWQANDYYGEDLRRAALTKERSNSVVFASVAKSDVQGQHHFDLGVETSNISAAKSKENAKPDKFSTGKSSHVRALTKHEQAVLSKTIQSLNSRIETMAEQQGPGGAKHTSEEAKAYQYSIEYLEKLRYKCKAPISPGFRLALQEPDLALPGTPPDIYWYFELIASGPSGLVFPQLLKMLFMPHCRNAHGPQSDYNRRRTLLVSGRHDYADMIAEQLADVGTGRQVSLIHDNRGSQLNKNEASAFRSGSRDILVCTMNWAAQFLTENVRQIVLYRMRAPDQSGAQAKKELRNFLTEIEGIKKKKKLVKSIRVKILFGPDEAAFKTIVEKVLRISEATCVDSLEKLESFFPRASNDL